MDNNELQGKLFKIKLWEHSKEELVTCHFASYRHNGTLALQLMSKSENSYMTDCYAGLNQFSIPFGVATVNLDASGRLPLNVQFIDENNMPGIGKWLENNHIAKPTGIFMQSGYVNYQAYAFNVPKQSLAEIESLRKQLGTLPDRWIAQSCDVKLK